jgi:hypothetical protein
LSLVLGSYVGSSLDSAEYLSSEESLHRRIEKARTYELSELIRLELSMLTNFYMRHMLWEKVIHYGIEEETLSVIGLHKFESLGKLLTAHMARRDYVRATLIADQIESTFHLNPDGNDEFYIYNEAHPQKIIDDIKFFLAILSLVGRHTSDIVFGLYKNSCTFGQESMNKIDADAYHFVLSITLGKMSEEYPFMGDMFLLLSDSSQLNEFIRKDPWLSCISELQQTIFLGLRELLRTRLVNVHLCQNERTRQYLLEILQTQ